MPRATVPGTRLRAARAPPVRGAAPGWASGRCRSPLGVRRLLPPLPPPPACECSGVWPVEPPYQSRPQLQRRRRRSSAALAAALCSPSEIHRVSRPLQPPRRAATTPSRPLGLRPLPFRCTHRCPRLRAADAAATDAAASSSSASPLFSLKANKHHGGGRRPPPPAHPLCGERARERRDWRCRSNIPGAHWPPPQGATTQHPGRSLSARSFRRPRLFSSLSRALGLRDQCPPLRVWVLLFSLSSLVTACRFYFIIFLTLLLFPTNSFFFFFFFFFFFCLRLFIFVPLFHLACQLLRNRTSFQTFALSQYVDLYKDKTFSREWFFWPPTRAERRIRLQPARSKVTAQGREARPADC